MFAPISSLSLHRSEWFGGDEEYTINLLVDIKPLCYALSLVNTGQLFYGVIDLYRVLMLLAQSRIILFFVFVQKKM